MINWHLISQFIPHFFSAKRNGHGIHSPFAYALCEEVFYNDDLYYDFEALMEVRQELLRDRTVIETEQFGAGSKTFRSRKRRIRSIAARGISNPRQSELIYRLINYLKYNSCIELGTSLGLNTLYMAKANTAGKVSSIEGSKALYNYAMALAAKNKTGNIRFMNGDFDALLPELLQHIEKADLVYIDGNHTYDATLRYFDLALSKTNAHSVIIFDDIYWSKGMTAAWKKIQSHPSVTLSIDGFYFGMVFFRPELREKMHLKIYL